MQFNVVWTYLWFSLGFSSFQTLCTSPVMFPPSLQSTPFLDKASGASVFLSPEP